MKTTENFKREYWTLWMIFREGLFMADTWYFVNGNEEKAFEMRNRKNHLNRYLDNLEKAIINVTQGGTKAIEL